MRVIHGAGGIVGLCAALSCGPGTQKVYRMPEDSAGRACVSDCDAKRTQCPLDCLAQYPISFNGQGTDTNNLPRQLCASQCGSTYDSCVTGCGARIEHVAAGQPPSGGNDGSGNAGGATPAGASSLAVGDRVSCNWKGGGTFYDGRVAEQRAGGRILIHYDDGDVEETTPDRCRVLAGGGGAPPPVAGGGLSGGYTIVSAANPGGGSGYTGTVRIAKAGDAYRLDWSIPGSPPYSGVGIEMNGILAVGWSVGGSPGVVVYRVSAGQLAGKWAALGSRGGPLGIEDLSGPSGVSGTYQITQGRNPQGGSYTGSVLVTPTGSTYALSWTLPRETYTGVGILKRDVLAVGWGPGTGVVAYEIHGNRLDGVWADTRGGSLGREVLERR